MAENTATARLRKTFKYPDENDEPEAIDEQEQEKVINELRKKNEDQNFEYIRLLVAMAATSGTLFAPIFYRTRLSKPKYLAAMGITSLILTIYMLVLIPNRGRRIPTKGVKLVRQDLVELTPLQRYVPYLNAILAALVGYSGLEFKDSPRVHDGFWMICFVPLVMYIGIQMARKFLVEVDIDELEDMRYDYKGA